jgi:mono/diheme cytochrome c family protein
MADPLPRSSRRVHLNRSPFMSPLAQQRVKVIPYLASALALLIAATILSAASIAADSSPLAAKDAARVDFNRDVIPILSANCFKCHGPDGENRKSGLRLDRREAAISPAESGKAAIVPGKPDESELVRRIFAGDPDERMPSKDSGKQLTDAQKQTLRRWIAEGAEYKQHWAFVPPTRPSLPAVKRDDWPKNPIDRFVLARLEAERLSPSREADRITLCRRLYLDMLGLPPTPEEVDEFVNDSASDAYHKLVEKLLASPHFGERLGRLWLDAARYADSDGYEKDKPRFVWFYRDWVVKALNNDLPYDRFVTMQLAGDLLPGASQDETVATGFLRNSMINEEGGVDPEQFRMDAMFDRMDAIGKGILGLTIQCAQCHDHKYDPLTQREYYQLFACLNNDDEANITVFTPEEHRQRAEVLEQIRKIEDELRRKSPDWQDWMSDWEHRVTGEQPNWIIVRPEVEGESTGGQKYLPMPDGSSLAQGYAPTKHTVRMKLKTDVKNITAFRLELLNDPNLPRGGPGRSIQGTAALTEFAVDAEVGGKTQKLKFAKATADYDPPVTPLLPMYDDKSKKNRVIGPIAYAIDGKDETAWATDADPGRRNVPHQAVFTLAKPLAEANTLIFQLKQDHGGWNSDDNQNHNLGRFRLSLTTTSNAEADSVPAAVREILAIPREKRTTDQQATVFSYWRTTVDHWSDVNKRIEELWKKHPEGATQLVLRRRSQPRETHLLNRGNFLKPGDRVEPAPPSFLNPSPAEGPFDRMALARWLTDRKAPTTARAIVNRIWQAYFGVGLVDTPEDFGRQGSAPSHPELLDWLAVELMESGWSLKELHRTIVTSATYRQSSVTSPELRERDPYNRLLARGARFRIEAESVRDVALAASGLLNDKLGGPSIHPPLPEFLFQPPVSYGPKSWPVESGADLYRRSLYIFRFRSIPHPLMQTFDAPNGDFACVRRSRSDTPLQALMTLNEPTFLECARSLALRTLTDGGHSDEDRMTFAFRRCLARRPSDVELATLKKLLGKEKQHFGAAGAKPWELATADPAHPPKLTDGASPADLAAWTVVSRALLNLDETITKE